jgi:hypothetical protein
MWMPPIEIDLFLLPAARRIDRMDEMKPTFDALRAAGHVIGDVYQQDGRGLMVVIDNVAIDFPAARAVARGWVTVAEIAAGRSRRQGG